MSVWEVPRVISADRGYVLFVAALHARAGTAAGLAVFGSLTGISALAALFVGIMLAE